MLQLEEALSRVLQRVPPVKAETLQLAGSDGRVLLQDIPAPLDLPPFDNSSVDGYAVRASDTNRASSASGIALKLAGYVPAGSRFTGAVESGQCVRIFTGSPVPVGADAVVMQEDTRRPPDSEIVEILDAVGPRENIRGKGQDIRAGTTALKKGTTLNAAAIALLSALGVGEILVGRQPTVSVLATGSELREPGQQLAPGEIYESNRAGVQALVTRAGGIPDICPIVRDNPAETRAAVSRCLAQSDMLITSGGVSVGDLDFVKGALQQNGVDLDFWKVAIKPGRPFVFGSSGRTLIFGLPGNPVSALVTFLLLVRPAILAWQGAEVVSLPICYGLADEEFRNQGDRRHFLRVKIDEQGKIRSTGLQASHALASLASANALLDMAPESSIAKGATIPVRRFDI